MGSQPHSHAPAQHLQGPRPHGPPSCTLASPAIPSTSLWGSAEPTPDKEEPQERGCQVWPQLRSPEISSGRGGPMLLCRVGACFCCQEDKGPQVKSLQPLPTACPQPRSLGYLDPSVPLLSGPPCRETLEGRAPSHRAALLPIIRLLSGRACPQLPGDWAEGVPPLPQSCHLSAPQAHCLYSLRLSAQDREAVSHIPHQHCYTHSGHGHGYCTPSILPSTAPGPQVRALATARGCSLVVSPPHSQAPGQ